MTFKTTAFASSMTVDDAKEYLKNYSVTRENQLGKEYTTQYVFDSEEDLNRAAAYIAENGLDKFNFAVEEAIDEVVRNESMETIPQMRTANPSAIEETVSGTGNQYVAAEAYGLASFDTLGTVEYSVVLSYRITISNEVFTGINNISFDIPSISTAGSWGNVSFSSYCIDKHCGVTASYLITKSIEIGFGDFSFEVKSETDSEIFSLLARMD